MTPEIEIQEKTHIFKKGMTINCTLKRADTPGVNYTWYSCIISNCNQIPNKWKLESHSYSLRLFNQIKKEIKYRCTARNNAGEDESMIISVYKKSVFVADTSKPNATMKTMLSILVPIGIITLFIVTAICFILYKRKKIYGGFYLFSYPPVPDYMENLDIHANMQEQLQKLPFIQEWEFPRERINFSKYGLFLQTT